MYYNSVRELARRRVPGAESVFQTLQQFFHRPCRTADEPTEMQVERDVWGALLHNRKAGKVLEENEPTHETGGKHVVVDETNKASEHFKETVEGEIDE